MAWTAWAGAALILLLLTDVFFTVLHPQAHGGPVNRVLMRTVWRGTRSLSRVLSGAARDRLLSLGAPALSAAVLIVWGSLLITGFALIYGTFPASFTHTQWVSAIGWAEAFYFSGVSATTLGMGDVLVEPGWLRGLAVAEGFLGFMLISLSAAYVLALYRAQSDASSLAFQLWGTLGDPPAEGVGRLLSHLDAAEDWADGMARSLAQVTTHHAHYPIVHYFRPPDPRQSVVRQTAGLLLLFRRLEECPGWEAGHPSLLMLRNVLGRYLEEVSRRFARHTGVDVEEDDEEEWSKRHRQALIHLGYEDAVAD